jgi:hypothetical protein
MFHASEIKTMDWARAIERNRDALAGIVAALFAMLGLVGDATVARISRDLHRAVLRVLRPAESAVRRLIVIAARGLVVKLPPARPKPNGRTSRKGGGTPGTSFQLFDPRMRFDFRQRRTDPRANPRVLFPWNDPHLSPLWQRPQPVAAPVPRSETQVDAGRLCGRLQALKTALADLPGQARRLARWRARRERMRARRPTFTSPLRPGRPPGYRKKPRHEVDEVLGECHRLARDATRHDTS